MKITEKQEALMQANFKNFCYVIWKHLELPEPTPLQYDIMDYLQFGPRRSQITAFRGVGKSIITSAFVCWVLWKDKNKKFLVVSAGRDRADAFARFTKQIITNVPFLAHLTPDKDDGNRDTQNIFDVAGCMTDGSPSVKSVGITGQLTGSRADYIIADDIEIPANSGTHDQREKLARLVTEFDAIIKPDGYIKYLGTPQTELSLYNTLYSKNFDMKIWPARVPTDTQAQSYGAKLAPFIRNLMLDQVAGTTTEPRRFTDEDLAERELSYGRSGFALQFMLDTSLSDAAKFPLKINDLIIYDVKDKAPSEIYWSNNPLNRMGELPLVALEGQHYYAPERAEREMMNFQMKAMSVDPSGRGEDETGIAIGKLLNGSIYVTKAIGLIGGYTDETLMNICLMAKEAQVNIILIESNFGDGMFSALLKPHLARIYPCAILEVRHNKQKELRIIDTLEPVMNQHRLIVSPSVIREDFESARKNYTPDRASQYMLMYQLARISKDRGSLKNDDRLDALAMLVAYFVEQLSADQDTQKKMRDEEAQDRMLNNFRREWYEEKGGGTNNSINLWNRLKR